MTINVVSRYFRSVWYPDAHPFTNGARVVTGKYPIEAFLKLILTLVGIAGEFVSGFDDSWTFTNVHDGQHMTMFAFFTVNGVVDLAYHYQMPALPPQLDYMAALLALIMEGVLFKWHLHGRPPMDVQVHTFLIYIIVGIVVVIICEMKYPYDAKWAIARSWLFIAQGNFQGNLTPITTIKNNSLTGSWFIQVGQILYPKFGGKPWKEDDHTEMLIVTIIFAWHVMTSLLIVVLIGVFMYFVAKRRFGPLRIKLHSNGKVVGNGTVYKRLRKDAENVELVVLSDDEEENDEISYS